MPVTIADRLRRRAILMTTDAELANRIRAATPAGWEWVETHSLEDLGSWDEILLYRFLLLDLDEIEAFDPIDVIREVRMQHQINVAVFCFGGDGDLRDEMRLNRADRFFDRDEIVARLPVFFEQYGWGGGAG